MLRSGTSSMAAQTLFRRFLSSSSSSSGATLLPLLLHRPTISSPSLPLSPFVPLPQSIAGNFRSYARGGIPASKKERDDDDDDDDDDVDDDGGKFDDDNDEMVGSDYSGSDDGNEDLSD